MKDIYWKNWDWWRRLNIYIWCWGRYSRGIYIGEVRGVSETTDKLTQLIQVESPVEFSKLYEIYVIDSGQIMDEEVEWWKDGR